MNKWKSNTIQFPRLISEINATQELNLKTLAKEMDLTVDNVLELFERAEKEFQLNKEVK